MAVLTVAAVLFLSAGAFADDREAGSLQVFTMTFDQDPKPAAPPAAAAEPTLPWRTFELIFGGMYSSASTSILLSRTDRSATLAIDAEGVLGMSNEVLSPYLWTAFRLGERHRLSFSFEDLTRSATRSIQKSIDVDGTTYPVGTSIHSELGLQLYDLSYVWSFLQDERMEMGLTFGLNVMHTHIALDVENPPNTINERYILPVPLPGLNADFVLIKDLWLRERLELMYVPIQTYAGLFIDFNVSVEYSFIKNLSVGLGFDLMRLALESTSNSTSLGSFDGKVKFNAAGLLFYINFHM